jgi:2-polyprenyl-3-methyl-5-hydroxy-6-metoxy-1,4-benzoquinol methylase
MSLNPTASRWLQKLLRRRNGLLPLLFRTGNSDGSQTQSPAADNDPFAVFLTPEASAINAARQAHLASLGLDLTRKQILEVGAGIGLHTPFFLERGCEVLVTDGNAENVGEIRRRLPNVPSALLDLEQDGPINHLGVFDIVYCYGLLYHLRNPEVAIAKLASVCRGQLLLETVVGLGHYPEVQLIRDFASNNQAVSGIGCRPTRSWIMQTLARYFAHAYVTRTQPDYPDFTPDWIIPETRLIYRGVFVGSKYPLANPELLSELPDRQPVFKSPYTFASGVPSEMTGDVTEILASAHRIEPWVHLTDIELANDQASIQPGTLITVTTAPQQWAYAAAIPLHPSGDSWGVVLKIRAQVTSGEIGFGILASDQKRFTTEQRSGQSAELADILLPLPPLAEGCSLILRNTAPNATVSQVILESIETLKLDWRLNGT